MRHQPSTALPPRHRFARALLAAFLLCMPAAALAESSMYGHVESTDMAPPPSASIRKTASFHGKNPPVVERPPAKESPPAKAAPAKAESKDIRTIGILLPLSGPNAALGKNLLDAATLALYDMQRNKPLDRAVPILRLAPKDTQGTPEGAQEAFRALMQEEHPVAILGPLFSTELEMLLPSIADANAPMIAFTNAARLAGRGAYQLGFMADEQAQMLAAYAKAQHVPHVAGIATADAYGRQMLDRLTKELKSRDIDYGPTMLLPPEGAIDEVSMGPMIDALKDRRSKRQFLFLGAQGAQLDAVVARLAKARVFQPNFALMGGGAWDDAQQLRKPALGGAIFVAPPREGFQKFATRYQSTYGTAPPRVAGLAYDSVALLASLMYSGGNAPLSDEALHDPTGFKTPTGGLLRFGADGTAERRLAIFLANGMGGARAIQNAASGF